MHLLELFSGTSSVGVVARSLGYNVISLDLKNTNINCDILEWDYTQFDRNHFQVIWASPPCTEYSRTKTTGVRKIDYANSFVLKTLEIIDYFKPTLQATSKANNKYHQKPASASSSIISNQHQRF